MARRVYICAVCAGAVTDSDKFCKHCGNRFDSLDEPGLTFNDIFKKKGAWVQVKSSERKKLADELFSLVDIAYYPIGGHLKVKSADDIIKADWDMWMALDYDSDPQADVVVFGRSTQFGVKWSGVGHDGSAESKKIYLNKKIADFKVPGNYGEVSEKLADILLARKVPYVVAKADIEKILGKSVQYNGRSTEGHKGEGWYVRNIGGASKEKILVGMPAGIKNLKVT